MYNKNIDKSNNYDSKSPNDSYKNKSEVNLPENNFNKRHNDSKAYIKCIFTLQPNTLEETKLLTLDLLDDYLNIIKRRSHILFNEKNPKYVLM